MLVGMDMSSCQGMAVSAEIMRHVVNVESSFNPYAIGVVGGRLVRQPKNLPEALATVKMLEGKGFNFSVGLAQVNRYNLDKYNLESYEKAFSACPNLQAGSKILAECFGRSGGDWGKSFSCYYSGNFITGYHHGYVQKVYASMRGGGLEPAESKLAEAIAVVGKPSRRTVGVSRHSLYSTPRPAQSLQQASAPPQPNVMNFSANGQTSIADRASAASSSDSSIDNAFVF